MKTFIKIFALTLLTTTAMQAMNSSTYIILKLIESHQNKFLKILKNHIDLSSIIFDITTRRATRYNQRQITPPLLMNQSTVTNNNRSNQTDNPPHIEVYSPSLAQGDCPVCLETKTVFKLRCNHHICKPCYEEMLKPRSIQHGDGIFATPLNNKRCPLCRAPF